jgi:thiosulfate/3-mercaptopyruvate sulfurtransferase
MLPSPMQFERQVSELGVNSEDHIVLYDQSGIYFASARAWWTFRVRIAYRGCLVIKTHVNFP